MHCQYCGAETTAESRYCLECGTELVDEAADGRADEAADGQADGTATGAGHGRPGGDVSGKQYQQPQQGPPGGQYQTSVGQGRKGINARGTGQQSYQPRGDHPTAGGQSQTLVVRTTADKYLRRFSRFNFALAILAVFFGFLAVVLGNFVRETTATPPEIDALFGVLYFVFFGFAALYLAVWYFSKRRSTIAVYLATAIYAIGTLVNLVTINPLGTVVTALGAYWGYKSFDAV